MESCTFRLELEKIKKSIPTTIPYISGNGNPEKGSYISGNGNFQSTPIKFLILQETKTPQKILMFFQKKAVLILQEMETPKKLFIFQEKELSYISENGNPKKLLIFQEVPFRDQKVKKKLLILQEVTCKD